MLIHSHGPEHRGEAQVLPFGMVLIIFPLQKFA
jgi:hypothetical protein